MKKTKFKTTINCGGCIATVTPVLNGIDGIKSWDVDTTSKDKILTIESEDDLSATVVEKITKAGFDIRPKKGIFGF
ncbi:MAG: copper chaperone [Sphingobacteriales bacterium]|jgi:copper chaperone